MTVWDPLAEAEEQRRHYERCQAAEARNKALLEPVEWDGVAHGTHDCQVIWSIAISLKRIADMLAVDALQRQHPLRRMDGGEA